MAADTLWQTITAELTREISRRRFKPGERFYTLKELSARFRISEITCRRVMHELENRTLIERIQGKGTFVRRTAIGRDLKLLLHPQLAQSGFSHLYLVQELLQGMHAAARAAECRVQMVSTEHFADHVQAGDLVVTLWHSRHAEALRIAVEHGAHVACTHAPEPVPEINTVRPDFAAGTAIATRHLLAKGHQRIAYVTGAVSNLWFTARFDGYYRTLREAGLPFDLALVRETLAEDGSDVAPAIADLLALPDPPTAVVCANDARALAVMRVCRERDVRIPGDLAVVGFDNTHDSALATPGLTTIDQFWQRQGSEAVALLLRLAENDAGPRQNEDLVLTPELVLRAST